MNHNDKVVRQYISSLKPRRSIHGPSNTSSDNFSTTFTSSEDIMPRNKKNVQRKSPTIPCPELTDDEIDPPKEKKFNIVITKYHMIPPLLDQSNSKDTYNQNSEKPEVVIPQTTSIPQPSEVIETKEKESSHKEMVIISFSLLVLALAFLLCKPYITADSNIEALPFEPIKINVSYEISLLPKSFPKQQEDTWKRLSIGIKNVQTFAEPAVFFMVQWNEKVRGGETSKNTALEIAEAAGMIAAEYLGNGNETASPIILSKEDMELPDHGSIVSLYKDQLEARHVMIIQNIEKVSGHIAQGLRYICDEHNPLVNRSAIFIILNADSCNGVTKNDILEGSTGSLIGHSERCLTDLWGGKNGLGPNVLMPLLTRIINSVIKIIPESESAPAVAN